MQGQLLKALAVSLLVHLLALSIPLGRLGAGLGNEEAVGQPGEQTFAPLRVALAPYALELPGRSAPDEAMAGRQASTASVIDSRGEQKGNRGDSAIILDETSSAPRVSLASPSPIHYYPPRELTRRARIVRDIDPYLGDLKNAPGSGKARVELWINEQGGVDRVKTTLSDLPEAFETAIASLFGRTRFLPAERDGVPVRSLMTLDVQVLPPPVAGHDEKGGRLAPGPAPMPAER